MSQLTDKNKEQGEYWSLKVCRNAIGLFNIDVKHQQCVLFENCFYYCAWEKSLIMIVQATFYDLVY